MSGTKTNVEHRFEKNDKLTRNKSSRNKKECEDLEEKVPSVKMNNESSRRDKSSFKINKCSKGKMQRDRRKMREKRRSTGVVYLGDTKDSGSDGSDDDDEHNNNEGYHNDDDDGVNSSAADETLRNTQHNESSNNNIEKSLSDRLQLDKSKDANIDDIRNKTSCCERFGSSFKQLANQNSINLEKIKQLEKDLADMRMENKKLLDENAVLLKAISKKK